MWPVDDGSEVSKKESGSPLVPPNEIRGSDRSFDQTVKDSKQGGSATPRDAESIARALGHNDPKLIEDYLNDEDH